MVSPSHFHNGILLDTNLLVLLTVGTLSIEKINTFKRTRHFVTEDFETLSQVLLNTRKLFTTPNILTETSNLLEGDQELLATLSILANQFDEIYLKSVEVMSYDEKCYQKFGLSDAVMSKIATDKILILTVDAPLYGCDFDMM